MEGSDSDMSVIICKTCEEYVDSDYEVCHGTADFNSVCESCVLSLSKQELIDLELDHELIAELHDV